MPLLNADTEGKHPGAAELKAVTEVLHVLHGLTPEDRVRVLESAAAFFGLATGIRSIGHARATSTDSETSVGGFSEDRTQSPKEFLLEKRPQTDVERIACLAYYITHYRSTPHFKTLDLSKLNTEAAQLKFSNAAWAVENATKQGYLVPATKGAKQISALGELYVQALPDRDSAKAAVLQAKPRKRNKRTGRSQPSISNEE